MPSNDSTNPATATQTGRSNRKTTASKPLLSSSKTIEEHAIGLGTKTDVNSLVTARKTLATHGLDLPTAGNTLMAISVALFEFSASANLGVTHTDILRAIAYAVHDAHKNIDTESIIAKTQALMGGPVATLDEKVEALENLLEKHKKDMEETVVEVRRKVQSSLAELVEAARSTRLATPQQTSAPDNVPGSNGQRSYASVTKDSPSPLLTKALAKSEAQARQILVDRRSPLFANALRDLTEAQLVAKATMAIEFMSKNNQEVPNKMAVLSVRKLSHGGALYEFDSAESVQWLNVPAHRSKFLEHFGIETVIKDRSFNVLIENIPIAFVPENSAALADVETKAGLKPKSIHKARYIKPIARRNPDQRTAHAIFTFGSKESANQAIKFGLSVEGKKVYGRKLISEPTRCLKCHSFDGTHVAANCPQDNDSCGTCSGAHRTSTCSVTDQNQYRCKNCEVEGHAAWSRNCPTFMGKWENHKKRNEDAKYRFYLTDDPLTWETLTSQDPPNDREKEQPTHQQTAPQQHQPPSNAPMWEWRTVNRNQPPRQTRQTQNNRNANLVPLGQQTRLPDNWIASKQPSQPPPRHNQDVEQQHAPQFDWNKSPYGSPYDQYHTEGWDQDQNNDQ